MTTQLPHFLNFIEYVTASGQSLKEMRENLLNSPEGQTLYNRSDVRLIWANEGDLFIHRMNIELYNLNVMMGTHNSPDEGI